MNTAEFTQLIDVSLAYRKIDWERTVAGTSGSNDWRLPGLILANTFLADTALH